MNFIRSIKIDNLFDSHNIEFELADRLTFIHGENGVGKTCTFVLTKAALALDYDSLSKVMFDQIEIQFLNNESLIISEEISDSEYVSNPDWPLRFYRIIYTKGIDSNKEVYSSVLYGRELSMTSSNSSDSWLRRHRSIENKRSHFQEIFSSYIDKYDSDFYMRFVGMWILASCKHHL